MLISNRWQSKTALVMALGMSSIAAVPLMMATAATASSDSYRVAQLFPSQRQPISQEFNNVTIPAGNFIPTRSDETDKIVITPDESMSITLVVDTDIRSSAGTLLIPAGSEIDGELRPDGNGTRFFAQELRIRNSNQRRQINATSQKITETETIKEGTDTSSILTGALIGAAAGTVLGEIFGDIDFLEVLGGAGAGALAGLLLGGRKEAEVFVINPDRDLGLTLQSDLVL
ncbi:MAG: hypothetical protein F6J86_10385 [Symploca sp. SIO1B1]|nr:hypothetical protein [Symploca sp. SIO1A3]NER94230.1 hypothetical protein [Symploca sp. SIO1B1]